MQIKLKSPKLRVEDVHLGNLYAKHDANTIFYVCEYSQVGVPQFLLVEIGKEGKFTGLYPTKEDLHSAMVSYGLRPADFDIIQTV